MLSSRTPCSTSAISRSAVNLSARVVVIESLAWLHPIVPRAQPLVTNAFHVYCREGYSHVTGANARQGTTETATRLAPPPRGFPWVPPEHRSVVRYIWAQPAQLPLRRKRGVSTARAAGATAAERSWIGRSASNQMVGGSNPSVAP